MERDPIGILGQRMEKLGIASADDLQGIDDAVRAEVQDAVDFAEQSPAPAADTVHEYVHA